jgi:ABC-2 type transport system permease protein
MTAMTHTASDSATMIRRSLRHLLRYPALSVQLALMPVLFLLLFVYVFGGTLGDGLGGAAGALSGRAAYVNYVTPGLILMTVALAGTATAITVAKDMTEGIIARFRTMSIARVSVLTGHVVGSLVLAMVGMALVTGMALLVGFRPSAGPVEWLAAAGVLAMITFALVWLCAALGLAAKTVESASNTPTPLTILPFFGSGFVPTDSMPPGLRAFAEYQPFTPFTDTVRGLLTGGRIGSSGIETVAWCAGIALVGYLWARKLYSRDPVAVG